FGCASGKNGTGDQTSIHKEGAPEAFAVKTVLREQNFVDPEKGIGVYGRYTELMAEGEVPEAFLKVLIEVNDRAKKSVETRAGRFLSENGYPPLSELSDLTDGYRYRNVSYIVNVTRADGNLFSILETGMENGIGDSEGADRVQSVSFHSSVYDTQSGRSLTLKDFIKDPESLSERINEALLNKYACEGLYEGGEIPAWTADYLGLRFYFDGAMIPEEKKQENGLYYNKAVHVSIPYDKLGGPFAEISLKTPECFIAQIEKNTEYALPYDKRVIRVEKAVDSYGYETYRIVIRDGGSEKYWWLEYADDDSDYYLMRTKDGYYFYRLQDTQDRAFVYDFESPDGGFDRFANQNAQCFDSFLHELYLAVPYDPECVHMRERSRRFMEAKSALNTVYAPNGHYSFIPEQGRGRTWLHFALIDDVLLLDSHNIGCRLVHEINATGLDDAGKENGKIQIPAGEVLRFLRVDGESELYYYMSPQYNLYSSGARDYRYDCALSDGREVRLVTRYENSFFVDGMYLDRIGEPVTLGAVRHEAVSGELPEHFVEIGGKKYRLIRDLSLKTEAGEEIDFDGDIWWKAENYTGTFSSEEEDAKLVIFENGEVKFDYQGRTFTGKLPEKRYYLCDVEVFMEAGYEDRTFRIIVEDKLPPHDPSFRMIRFYSEGLPATNEPSKVPPIEVELLRE
nr:hypothetical protein [Lachnospiraceae bacterium]